MKFTPYSLIAAAILVAFAGTARAQFLTPQFEVINDSGVSTTGTEVWGGHNAFGNDPQTLANGVTFNNMFNNSNFVTDPVSGVSVDSDGAYRADQTGYPGGSTPFGDAALNDVLNLSSVGSFELFKIAGLTPGHVYQVEIFSAMTNNGNLNGSGAFSADQIFHDYTTGQSETLSYGQTPSGGGTGAFAAMDTFVANSSGIEVLQIDSSNADDVNLLNAGEVRDISDVPEPSTYALMFAGIAILGFCVRRKGTLSQ